MKTFFTTIILIFSTLVAAQQNKTQKLTKDELKVYNKLQKSYYYNINPINLIFYAKSYNCLNKHYNINLTKEKEFLNKKDFFKSYPNWELSKDRDYEYSSTLQTAQQTDQFDINKKSIPFPKCIKKPF